MADAAEATQRNAISVEVSRIHESAIYSAQGQLEAAKFWRGLHWTLGALAAALSTAAAVITFAAAGQVASGVLAVLAAITAALMTGARPDRLAERAQSSGNDYTRLRNDVRRLRDIQVPMDALPELRNALAQLAERESDLNHAADPIPRLAYLLAKRNIERDGGQRFKVDAA
ncbi:SLATT domain-containing protein [Micrococcus sp. NPDC078436]|uniref:SLATT domain-containing protein n=1 Tax=Micrococcus sp. NPDC078436 TaxID=3154960 RepID=UPI00344D746F